MAAIFASYYLSAKNFTVQTNTQTQQHSTLNIATEYNHTNK